MEIVTIKTGWFKGQLKQNSYVIKLADGCVLIDAGCPKSEVEKLTNLPVKAVFITHAHLDHINYVEEYDKLNIPIYASEKTKDFWQDIELNASNMFGLDKTFIVNNYKPIKEGDKFTFEDCAITCFESPGHTADGMVYLLTTKDEKILFSGDTLFSIAVGRTDLPSGNLEELKNSLHRLEAMEYDKLLSGHGAESSKQAQAKNITYWLSYLEDKNDS